MQVPEAEVATEYFFGMFATYISSVYVIPSGKSAGQGYHSQTAEVIFNDILNGIFDRPLLETREVLLDSKEVHRPFSPLPYAMCMGPPPACWMCAWPSASAADMCLGGRGLLGAAAATSAASAASM